MEDIGNANRMLKVKFISKNMDMKNKELSSVLKIGVDQVRTYKSNIRRGMYL